MAGRGLRHVTSAAVLGAVVVAVAGHAVAADDPALIAIVGAGQESCGGWTDGRRNPGTPEAELRNVARVHWVLGYITANNYLLPADRGPKNIAEGTDHNGIMAWIDNYCAANPLVGLHSATDALVAELWARWGAAYPSQ